MTSLLAAAIILGAQPTFDDARTTADTQLQAILDRSPTPGLAVAIMHDGVMLYEAAHGFADLELEVPAEPSTRFAVGSISKCLTAVAAYALDAEGALDVDAPIEWLPRQGVTVRHILTHTSGLDDAFAAEHYWTTESFTIRQAADRIRHDGLAFEPGAGFRYATGAFTLVGAEMERAGADDFESLVREHVLEPAKMTSTTINRPREIIPGRTRFYMLDDDGGVEHAPTTDPSHKLPGAGYLTTAGDLARFGDALMAGALLDKAALERLWTEAVTDDGPCGYTAGFRIDEDPSHGPVFHLPGGGPGISAWIMLYPERRMTFVILANMTSAPVGGREFAEVQEAFLQAAASPRH